MRRSGFHAIVPAAVILLAAGAAGAEITVSHVPSDAMLDVLVESVAFTAEGRIGDRSGAATFELDLGPETSSPSVTSQYGWESGRTEVFQLAYYPASGLVAFRVGAITLDYMPSGSFEELFLRARSTRSGATLRLEDLTLDGEPIIDSVFADGDDDGLDILRIQGADLESGFRLAGEAILTWGEETPRNSHLAFQIKAADPAQTTSVENASWGSVKRLFR